MEAGSAYEAGGAGEDKMHVGGLLDWREKSDFDADIAFRYPGS